MTSCKQCSTIVMANSAMFVCHIYQFYSVVIFSQIQVEFCGRCAAVIFFLNYVMEVLTGDRSVGI